MSQDVTLFGGQGAELPAHLQQGFGDSSNIDTGSNISALSIRGKVFRIIHKGDEVPLMRRNPETGDDEPVSVLNVIVVNQGPFGARVFYEGDYGSEDSKMVCFSLDGERPDGSAPTPQSATCAMCPHAVKGSKVTPSGKLSTACSFQRRLAVVNAANVESPALLLRLAGSSAYDPNTKNAENGWMAWRQYLDFLNARGVRHTAQVVTAMRFDMQAEHPKLLFKPTRFVEPSEVEGIQAHMESDEVKAMLFPQQPAAVPPEPPVAASQDPAPAPAAAPTPTPAAPPAPPQQPTPAAAPPPPPAPPAPPAPPPAPAAAPAPQQPGPAATEPVLEGGQAPAPPKKKRKKKVSKKSAAAQAPEEAPERAQAPAEPSAPASAASADDVAKLLDDWSA